MFHTREFALEFKKDKFVNYSSVVMKNLSRNHKKGFVPSIKLKLNLNWINN